MSDAECRYREVIEDYRAMAEEEHSDISTAGRWEMLDKLARAEGRAYRYVAYLNGEKFGTYATYDEMDRAIRPINVRGNRVNAGREEDE